MCSSTRFATSLQSSPVPHLRHVSVHGFRINADQPGNGSKPNRWFRLTGLLDEGLCKYSDALSRSAASEPFQSQAFKAELGFIVVVLERKQAILACRGFLWPLCRRGTLDSLVDRFSEIPPQLCSVVPSRQRYRRICKAFLEDVTALAISFAPSPVHAVLAQAGLQYVRNRLLQSF